MVMARGAVIANVENFGFNHSSMILLRRSLRFCFAAGFFLLLELGSISICASALASNRQLEGCDCSVVEQGGRVCYCSPEGDSAGYPQPVALVIPDGASLTVDLKLAVYFHGNTQLQSLRQLVEGFNLAQSYLASKPSGVLVIPFSPSPSQRLGVARNYFKDHSDRFTGFISAIGRKLVPGFSPEALKSVPLTLASHSGGCFPLASILETGALIDQVKAIVLLDSAYRITDNPAPSTDPPALIAREVLMGRMKLWSTYTVHNSGVGKNADLIAKVDQPVGTCWRQEWSLGRSLPDVSELQSKSCGFIDLGQNGNIHDEHVKSWLGVLLKGVE